MEMTNDTKEYINGLVTFKEIDGMDVETYKELKSSFLNALYDEYIGMYDYIGGEYIHEYTSWDDKVLEGVDNYELESIIYKVCDCNNPYFERNVKMECIKDYIVSDYCEKPLPDWIGKEKVDEFLEYGVEVDWNAFYNKIGDDLVENIIPE